ncbi:hypothetical protein BASA50_000434 [Batrachochytrium salamandrivorans]|uniref:Peptidyl-prolyl cis-trans isomerase n=1 Tax=Batrachochytrium salamandrivorans TaxID=1357716 RepID=A0ABQ8ETS1_9FUNG|nr:hypothetical protein BASA50_000434 [Batrachochytrium salamandrivorans]
MSVLLETSLGEIVIDLEVEKAPQACLNFLKLCKLKYYNFSLVHSVQKHFVAQMGDPTGKGTGGNTVWGVIQGKENQVFEPELHPKLKHTGKGIVSMALVQNEGHLMAGSQFLITLSDNHLGYLDGKQAIFGRVAEGLETLDKINETICDQEGRPYRDIRIKHTIILDDPFDDPEGLVVPDRSPIPSEEMLKLGRIGEEDDLQPTLSEEDAARLQKQQEANARALTLEMIGDLPFADIKPPENILFVCKLNPVTRDEDLELIFSRFGTILSCEIIRDKKTQESLCYSFIEFETKEQCEEAYFKMDNVLIDDRRIHVDFSQSVSKLHREFLVGKRGMADSFGDGLEKRRRYRDDAPSHEDHSYDLVFEHGGDLHSEKKPRSSAAQEVVDSPSHKPTDYNRDSRYDRSSHRNHGTA